MEGAGENGAGWGRGGVVHGGGCPAGYRWGRWLNIPQSWSVREEECKPRAGTRGWAFPALGTALQKRADICWIVLTCS